MEVQKIDFDFLCFVLHPEIRRIHDFNVFPDFLVNGVQNRILTKFFVRRIANTFRMSYSMSSEHA